VSRDVGHLQQHIRATFNNPVMSYRSDTSAAFGRAVEVGVSPRRNWEVMTGKAVNAARAATVSALRDPHMQALHSYWLAKRGDRSMPTRGGGACAGSGRAEN